MPTGTEDAARAFYVGVLGFEEIPKPGALAKRGGAWFRSGAVMHDDIPFEGREHCYNADPFGNRIELITDSVDS